MDVALKSLNIYMEKNSYHFLNRYSTSKKIIFLLVCANVNYAQNECVLIRAALIRKSAAFLSFTGSGWGLPPSWLCPEYAFL